MKKMLVVIAAALVAIAIVIVPSGSANASGTHRITFKAWGIPRAMVEVDGHSDIEMMRRLPYSNTQYLSGWDYTFASITVDDISGYRTVGCAIYDNGRLVSRDVSDYGFAWCMTP